MITKLTCNRCYRLLDNNFQFKNGRFCNKCLETEDDIRFKTLLRAYGVI